MLCIHLQAQQSFRFKHWGVEDGLSQSTITQITQDKDGFIWLGTQDGLNRFDGYSFKIYRNKENNAAGLSNNYIMSLVCDSVGNIWAGTTNGLNRISRTSGQVHHIALEKFFPSARNYRIHALCAAEKGGVYVATSYSIIYVDTLGNIFRLPQIEPILPSGSTSMVFDGVNLFFASAKKIWQYTPSTKAVKALSAECGEVYVLSVANSNLLYRCGTELKCYKLKTATSANYQLSSGNSKVDAPNIQSVLQLKNEDWICTDNGLIWRRNTDTLLIKHDEKNERSLSSDFVYAVFCDKNKNYWIGTGRGGLCMYPAGAAQVTWLSKNIGVTEAVWQSLVKSDTLYLATSKGVKIFKIKNPAVALSADEFPEKNLQQIYLPALQKVLVDELITSVDCDVDGNLWFGTERMGVFVFTPKQNRIRVLQSTAKDTNSLISDRVMYLSVLNDTTVGVCSAYGLSLINTRTLKCKRVYLSSLLPGLNNYVMKASSDGATIWLSSANGLCKYNLVTNALEQYLPDANHPQEQYHNIVSDAKVDSDGSLWLSTMGYGLHHYNVKTHAFERFGSNEGLGNENLLRVQLAKNGCIWTASHDGIACFDKNQKRFYNFGVEEGFENKECTMNGFYEARNGDYYVGTVGGLAIFNPDKLIIDSATANMVISGIKVNYEDLKPDGAIEVSGSISKPTKVILYENAKTIEFELSALRYGKSKSLSYMYRLQGFDVKWVQLPFGARLAAYTNLPEGHFVFQVIPVLQGKALVSKMLKFEVQVIPPFYKTWWFKVVIVFLAMGLTALSIVAFYRRKLRIQQEKAEQELRIQKEKERISRELHDNVGSQLTYIIKSIDTLSYKSTQQPGVVQEGLDSLSDFSRDTLNQLRESIWAINTKEITLRELEAKIQDHISKINARVSGKEVVLQTKLLSDPIINPTKAIGLFRIVQEALVNSIKYAECERIELVVEQLTENDLLVLISDEGKGFELGLEKSHSYGLKNMQARAEEIGARFKISSAPGKGTQVELICRIT